MVFPLNLWALYPRALHCRLPFALSLSTNDVTFLAYFGRVFLYSVIDWSSDGDFDVGGKELPAGRVH